MTILMTGASSKLGLELLRILSTDSVYAISRRPKTNPVFPNVQWISADAYFAQPSVAENVTGVIHIATDYGRSVESLPNVIEANVHLPLRLISNHRKLQFFMYVDSYYSKVENYPYLPFYGISKAFFNDLVRTLLASQGRPETAFVRCMLEHLYGPEDIEEKFVKSTALKLLRNERVELTSGHQIRDFIYIDDAASALATIFKSTSNYWAQKSSNSNVETIEIGSGMGTSIRELVSLMADLSGSESILEFGALPSREGEINRSVADVATLSSLGWKPRVSLPSGLTQVIKHASKEVS